MLKDPTPAPLPRKGGERLRMDFSQSCRLFLYLVIFPVLQVKCEIISYCICDSGFLPQVVA